MSCLPTLDSDESDLTPLTDTDFSDEDDSDFELARPQVKRPRVSRKAVKQEKKEFVVKKRRGLQGALQGMWTLPMDATFEIFGHLRPLDLLHLARTNKELRRILMRRSSLSVWMKARSSMRYLPDCPFDLSEPQYASLMFEHVCQYCAACNVQTVVWEARVRCCKRCGPLQFNYWVNIENAPDILQSIVPSTHEFSTGTIHPHTEKKYCIAMATSLADDMNALPEEERPLWFWNKKKQHDQRVEHAELCREWLRGQHDLRGLELNEIRLRRSFQIIEKLAELGWVDEMTKMSSHLLADHKHVKVPKELTDRSWRKIKDEMVIFMEDVRATRLEKERCQALNLRIRLLREMYDKFVTSRPLHSILPGVADYANIPEIKAILENPNSEQPVTLADFEIGEERMVTFAQEWREARDKQLIDIVRQSSIGGKASKEILSRATTLFHCKSCSAAVSYPRVLVHSCNASRTSNVPDPAGVFERLRAEPWNLGSDRISFHEAAHKRAKYILRILKRDPYTTTFEEMMAANPFVECQCNTCFQPSATGAVRSFARWIRMVEHTPRFNDTSPTTRIFRPVDDRRKAQVEKVETIERNKLRRDHDWGDYSYRSYCCIACKMRETRNNVEHHLRTKHSIVLPLFGIDYTFHLDARINLRAPLVSIKSSTKPSVKPAATAPNLEQNTVSGSDPTSLSTGTQPPISSDTSLDDPSSSSTGAPPTSTDVPASEDSSTTASMAFSVTTTGNSKLEPGNENSSVHDGPSVTSEAPPTSNGTDVNCVKGPSDPIAGPSSTTNEDDSIAAASTPDPTGEAIDPTTGLKTHHGAPKLGYC
ncbi:hypothetical protein FA15DRAFT_668141 [Coprinopsis marcescibilis]|uniref:F-box domain-containing protein n=1 Tax=Coprinopsis marcescibilis TaxID=230819 RepID=A0A5C3L166_COPMA|nr:hypothetical protein FA15DRAFT_668141 [Coprinopsis marcescibilis]